MLQNPLATGIAVPAQSPAPDPPSILTITDVSKYYGPVAALSGVSLDVRAGEVHALLGENGAGKSTLMGIASGEVRPDAGTVAFGGEPVGHLTPAVAASLGIAIVHQHPALLPDLTVAENLRIAVPSDALAGTSGGQRAAMQRLLDDVDCSAHLDARVSSLPVAQKHLLELAKALATSPRLLILDEPTAPLGQDSTDLLFERVRAAAARGTAVVYITHRLAEVRQLADRVTVLRDGKSRGTSDVASISDDDILALIVGRQLDSTFPDKSVAADGAAQPVMRAQGLTGTGFTDVSFEIPRGHILGVAGVVGNGQAELLRALAGLDGFSGDVSVAGRTESQKELLDDAAYLPADRHREGLMMSLSVRENAAVAALPRLRRGPLLSRRRENQLVGDQLADLRVKAASMEAGVASLSGGNQQKVVLARALLSQPRLVLADEPTQGVDVGARAEIYRLLRDVADTGVPVIVASSDAKELEGLCDSVLVMSRGRVVADLHGPDVTEERMIHAAVRATGHHDPVEQAAQGQRRGDRLRRFLQGDYAPVLVLLAVMLALGAYIYGENDRYLSAYNINSVLLLVAALGFIALGQTVALLVGGIDLSVGPLAGFLVVVGSFFINDGRSGAAILTGFLCMLAAAVATGAVNGAMIRYANFTAVAATLTTYIALGGFAYLLRDAPGGIIHRDVTDAIMYSLGPIPVAFVVLVAAALALEAALRRTDWGLHVRAVGSHEDSARRLGVRVDRTVLLAFVTAAAFTFLGAVVLLAQLGTGDPAQGTGYTLSSITAVVLGGTSLLGGRGTFVGTLLGAGLIIQVLNATTFLGLSQSWQYLFQGGLVVVAAVLYSQVRGTRASAA